MMYSSGQAIRFKQTSVVLHELFQFILPDFQTRLRRLGIGADGGGSGGKGTIGAAKVTHLGASDVGLEECIGVAK